MFNQRKIILIGLSLLYLSITPSFVHAIMIEGEMSIVGTFQPTGGASLADASGIDFMDVDGDYGTPEGAFVVGAVSGDFASYISVGGFFTPTVGYIQDIHFASFSAVAPLWQVGGFYFDLLTLSVEVQTADSLVLRGSGEIYGNDYDRTYGSWILTANGGKSTFSWSATTKAPETSSFLLMVMSMMGFVFFTRRRRV